MDRRFFLLSGTAVVSAMVVSAQTDGAKLDVQVSYTGSGMVDESHQAYVVLWDTPDFAKGDPGGPPIAVKGITSKSSVAHFDGLQTKLVYAGLVFDPSGKWDAASPPPTGSSIGLYATDPGTPAPIKLDASKTTKVSATFDDSMKVP